MTYSEEHEVYIREHGDIQPDEDFEMNLSVADRKKLWGKGGGKCSICKCTLFLEEKSDTNIGEECHISSESPDWPSKEFSRYRSKLTPKQRNRSYNNAILLCSICHKIIDNPRNTQYTIKALRRIKKVHEADVAKNLKEDVEKLELEQKMIIHSKILANEELKPMTFTHIGFDFNGKLVIQEPSFEQKYEDYYLEVNEHLEEGYPEIWEHKKKSEIFIDNHNKLLLELLKDTTDKVLNEIKKRTPTLIGWDGKGQRPDRYFSTKYITPNIQGIIQSSYDKMFDIDTNCYVVQDKNIWKVVIDYKIDDNLLFKLPTYQDILDRFFVFINATSIAESDNESEIQMIRQMILSILKNLFTQKDFIRLRIYKKDAETEYSLFLKGIVKLIKNIEHNVPLKSKCEICKNY